MALRKTTPLPDPVSGHTLEGQDYSADLGSTLARLPQLNASFIDPINAGIPAQEKAYAPGVLAILDRYLASPDSFGDSKRNLIAQHEQDQFDEANKPQMQALAQMKLALEKARLSDIASLDPRERLAALTNASEYGKNLATQFGAQNVNGGDSRVFGNPAAGGSVFTAPKLDNKDGVAFTQTPTALEIIGKLPQAAKPEWKERKFADGHTEWVDLNAEGGAGSEAPASPAAASGPVYDQIAGFAAKAGAAPGELSYLNRLAQVESAGKPGARNGSSTGVFQFHPDTFAKVGGTDINDVGQQTQAALNLSRQDRATLQGLGLQPTDANVYIMHQQGAGGGKALLTAPPEVNAVAALTPVYGDASIARKAIVGNGGTADMTAGEFVDMWRKKWGGGQAPAKGGRVVSGSEAPSDAENEDLSPEAIDLLAAKMISTGQVPAMGMGKAAAANRNKVYNRFSAMAKELGLDANDLVAGNASIKALGLSLNKITTQRGAVAQLEETAKKNADLVLSLAPKGAGPTNVPVLNRWIQAGRKNVAGDVDVTRFDNALSAFSEEYAKVMSGSLGNQAATDSARHDAKDRLGKYATQGQLVGGIDVMKSEMANRMEALAEVENGIRQSIRNGGRAAPADASGEAPAPAPQASGPVVRDNVGRTVPKGMHDAMQQFRGSKAAAGTPGNPRTILDDAGFAAVPRGQYYMGPDGQVRGPKP